MTIIRRAGPTTSTPLLLRRQRGFTLLEMILALAIFAILGITGLYLLQTVIRTDGISQEKSQRLAELQRAFAIIDRDFSAMRLRPVRTSTPGVFDPALKAEHSNSTNNDAITFTQAAWFNPGAQLPRSTLQRVTYQLQKRSVDTHVDGKTQQSDQQELQQQELQRQYFDRVDVPSGATPHLQHLLSNVSGLKLRYYQKGQWLDSWSDTNQLPEAIEVTLTLPDYGDITRRFLIANGEGGK